MQLNFSSLLTGVLFHYVLNEALCFVLIIILTLMLRTRLGIENDRRAKVVFKMCTLICMYIKVC